jgi:hypothetical protein
MFLRGTGENRWAREIQGHGILHKPAYDQTFFRENSVNNLYLCWLWKAIIHKSLFNRADEFYDSIERSSRMIYILRRAQHNV